MKLHRRYPRFPSAVSTIALLCAAIPFSLFPFACSSTENPADAGDGNGNGNGDANDPAITAIAQAIQDRFGIPDSAFVIYAGPVEPGTVLRENVSPDSTGVSLAVPDSAGEYYAMLIDYEPGRAFGHPVAYAWIEIARGDTASVEAERWMTIDRPGIEPAPFVPEQADVIEGTDYYYMKGEGAADEEDPGDKELAENAPLDTAAVKGVARAPFRFGIVLDGGGTKGVAEGGKFDPEDKKLIGEAKLLAERNADPMAAWLGGEGFAIQRISQWWGNAHPYTNAGNLLTLIKSYGDVFKNRGMPEGGCDNFYLYITAHGYKGSKGIFELHRPEGDGNFTFLGYDTLLRAFQNYPSWVKVTIHVDICYGGQLLTKHDADINKLCETLCGLTLMSSVDAEHTAWVPDDAHDSGTQDFLQGANEDHDGDGRAGDIQDRFQEMKSQGLWLGPLSFHCPSEGSWCVLDGPTSITEGCHSMAGVYSASTTRIIDPGGHEGAVGDPFADSIRVTISDDGFTVTGGDPFVNVWGYIDDLCNFAASGFGTVAGVDDVLCEFTGSQIADSTFDYRYVMGLRGELGAPITFEGEADVFVPPTLACPRALGVWQITVSSVFDPTGNRENIGDPFASPVEIRAVGNDGFLAIGSPPFVDVAGEMRDDCVFIGISSGPFAGMSDVAFSFEGSAVNDTTLSCRLLVGTEGEFGSATVTYFANGVKIE